MAAPRAEPSLGELFGRLSQQASTLVHKEIELAKAEVEEAAKRTTSASAMIGVGGAVVYLALFVLALGAVFLLATLGLALWVSALIVGVVIAAIGGLLIWRGVQQLRARSLAPTRTIRTLREDAEWAKEQRP